MHKMKKCAFSVKDFHAFLSIADETGVLSQEDVQKWQETLHEFQTVMQPNEREDLRSLDIEGVSQRYTDLVSRQNVSITPWLIHSRKQVLQNAIGNFVAYAINPAKYCDSMKESALPELDHHPLEFEARRQPHMSSAGAV